ncbi:MAG: PepSY domain-containing protein [Notoacmeibacter sp.]
MLARVIMPYSRRNFILRLIILATLCGAADIALAESGSGSSGSGSSGSGSSGGDDSSGSDDDKDDSENNGSGKNDNDEVGDDRNDGSEIDQEDARKAIKSGEAMALRNAIKRARDHSKGRIIDVELTRSSGKFIYVFTVVETSGHIKRLKMDAVSGKFAGMLGF